ncbi:M23 family metallopeptidase [Streptomyces sp. NPDC053474]|uniref:M23 family metallopeptidase n=1 Tax=Streptomyces sp. NPDC053474 TaxID=3365704 RepID=UPI0037D7CD39
MEYVPDLVFPVAGMSWADFRERPELRGADAGEPGRGGWHYRRSESHVHKGIDLKAPIGTPLLAVERGTAEFILAEEGRSGGHRVRLTGASGALYHYLHLGTDPADPKDAFPAEFIGNSEGPVAVTAGTVIGYLGHTGGAVADGRSILARAAHLHFQYHPNADRVSANPAHLFDLIESDLDVDGYVP